MNFYGDSSSQWYLVVNLKVVGNFNEGKEEDTSHWVSILYFSTPFPLPYFIWFLKPLLVSGSLHKTVHVENGTSWSCGLDNDVNVELKGHSSCYLNRGTDADCK